MTIYGLLIKMKGKKPLLVYVVEWVTYILKVLVKEYGLDHYSKHDPMFRSKKKKEGFTM
jgi:hypothetical protein